MDFLRYHPLLIWAVLQKMAKGMTTVEVEQEYGIPAPIAWVWRRRASQ